MTVNQLMQQTPSTGLTQQHSHWPDWQHKNTHRDEVQNLPPITSHWRAAPPRRLWWNSYNPREQIRVLCTSMERTWKGSGAWGYSKMIYPGPGTPPLSLARHSSGFTSQENSRKLDYKKLLENFDIAMDVLHYWMVHATENSRKSWESSRWQKKNPQDQTAVS